MSLEQAKKFLLAKRLDEAEAILRTMPDDPTAQQWLERIQQRKRTTEMPLMTQVTRRVRTTTEPAAPASPPVTDTLLMPAYNPASSIPPRPRHSLDVIVTTMDARQAYTVMGPVFFQISNKGDFVNPLIKLKKKYREDTKKLRDPQIEPEVLSDWANLWLENSSSQNEAEVAFFVAVRELQTRAYTMGSDAIIGMRQEMIFDPQDPEHFTLVMYGTAVRYVR